MPEGLSQDQISAQRKAEHKKPSGRSSLEKRNP